MVDDLGTFFATGGFGASACSPAATKRNRTMTEESLLFTVGPPLSRLPERLTTRKSTGLPRNRSEPIGPIPGAATVVGDGDDQEQIAANDVHKVVRKARDANGARTELTGMTGERMRDRVAASFLEGKQKPIAVTVALALHVGRLLDQFRFSGRVNVRAHPSLLDAPVPARHPWRPIERCPRRSQRSGAQSRWRTAGSRPGAEKLSRSKYPACHS